MRTLKEITDELKAQFMTNPMLKELYGIEDGEEFGDHFGKVSIEGLLIYIAAYCTYVLERIFGTVQDEIEELINRQSPGRPEWYARKLLEYIHNVPLDEYGEFVTDGMEESEIEKRRIIKHAVAIDADTGVLVLKVAGDKDGRPCQIEDCEYPNCEALIQHYIDRIKYAGVRTQLINQPGDIYNASISIWYDALMHKGNVDEKCTEAIRQYLCNLPFNGEYSHTALIDALQRVKGVDIVEVRHCEAVRQADGRTEEIADLYEPYAGYLIPGEIEITYMEH